MPTSEKRIPAELPETLKRFIADSCGIDTERFRPLPGAKLNEPARGLLDHSRDMTSTLAAHHRSALRVEVLKTHERAGLYLREVFLRTETAGEIVEFGVLAVALDRFSSEAQAAIRAGRRPLGALLHDFKIQFTSAPIGFFCADRSALAATALVVPAGAECFGRFNCLSTPAGEPLAWIMEILPPAASA